MAEGISAGKPLSNRRNKAAIVSRETGQIIDAP